MISPPEDLDARISSYELQASKKRIAIERIADYARILVAAEEAIRERKRLENDALRSTSGAAGCLYGFDSGESDPATARKIYSAGRQAQQEIHASARAAAAKLARLKTLLEKHRRVMHIDLIERFPEDQLLEAINLIQQFALASKVVGKPLLPFRSIRSELSLTCAGHAFVWWRFYVPKYRGKLRDMHQLARAWRLSDAKDEADFERSFRRLTPKKVTHILGCPPWALPK